MYISAVDVAFLTVSRGGSKITKRGGLVHGGEVWLGNLLFERWGRGVFPPTLFLSLDPSNTKITLLLVPTQYLALSYMPCWCVM